MAILPTIAASDARSACIDWATTDIFEFKDHPLTGGVNRHCAVFSMTRH